MRDGKTDRAPPGERRRRTTSGRAVPRSLTRLRTHPPPRSFPRRRPGRARAGGRGACRAQRAVETLRRAAEALTAGDRQDPQLHPARAREERNCGAPTSCSTASTGGRDVSVRSLRGRPPRATSPHLAAPSPGRARFSPACGWCIRHHGASARPARPSGGPPGRAARPPLDRREEPGELPACGEALERGQRGTLSRLRRPRGAAGRRRSRPFALRRRAVPRGARPRDVTWGR